MSASVLTAETPDHNKVTVLSCAHDGCGESTTGRIDILGKLQGDVMVLQSMQIVQISSGGAHIDTPLPIHLDSLHELRLTLGGASIIVKGRNVHSSISDVEHEHVMYRSGVEFVEPSDHVAAIITKFVSALQSDRAGSDGI